MSSLKSSARWRRRKAARPQEIQEAALVVFAEKGFAATRMEDIAAQAGVTKGTIYLYFQSKEAVFKSLLQESVGRTIDGVAELASSYTGSAADLLRAILSAIGTFMRTSDRVVLLKVLLAESGNFPDLITFYRRELIDRGLALLAGVVARGIARGEFRDMIPDHAARLCIAPILLSGIWRTVFGRLDKEPFDYAGFLETHIDTLLRGLAAEKGAGA